MLVAPWMLLKRLNCYPCSKEAQATIELLACRRFGVQTKKKRSLTFRGSPGIDVRPSLLLEERRILQVSLLYLLSESSEVCASVRVSIGVEDTHLGFTPHFPR